jgi:hypothetical protein
MKWAELHQVELLENWSSLTTSGNSRRIGPHLSIPPRTMRLENL